MIVDMTKSIVEQKLETQRVSNTAFKVLLEWGKLEWAKLAAKQNKFGSEEYLKMHTILIKKR